MNKVDQIPAINILHGLLLCVLVCLLADFIPDWQLDTVQYLLEFTSNLCHHYNFIRFYLILCNVKIIWFYFLLIPNSLEIAFSINPLMLLLLVILLFIIITHYFNLSKVFSFCLLCTYHKLKQNVIKAFENIP